LHRIVRLAVINFDPFNTGGDMLNASICGATVVRASLAVAILTISAGVHAQGSAKAAVQSAAAPAPAIVGSAEAGAKKNSMCIGCHGIPEYKTAFPVTYRVPKISGQSEKYLEAALLAYRNGERPHPGMRGVANGLSDQDIADLAAYYSKRK
jgi:cytochrome c553